MSLGIIIPVFNRKAVTLRCLRQLYAQQTKDMEVIIVDDGSKDGTFEAISLHYPKVHIVRGTGNWWYTKSVNEGIKFAEEYLKCDKYLLLNDDVILDNNYLQTVESTLKETANQYIIFGSVSFDSNDEKKPTFLGVKKVKHWKNKQYHYTYNNYLLALQKKLPSWESKFIPGRGMFFTQNTFQANGYLDESFPQYGSDYEYSASAITKGIQAEICLDAVLFSLENLTGNGSPKNKPSLTQFIKSLFNKYSPTYPINDSKLIWRHGNRLLMPISFPIIIMGKIKAYLKYR